MYLATENPLLREMGTEKIREVSRYEICIQMYEQTDNLIVDTFATPSVPSILHCLLEAATLSVLRLKKVF